MPHVSSSPLSVADVPSACSLGPADAVGRVSSWNEVCRLAIKAERTDNGAVVEFPLSLKSRIDELISLERTCCPFLSFRTELDGGTLRVSISSSDADGRDAIAEVVERSMR
jgi:hypothetical protein